MCCVLCAAFFSLLSAHLYHMLIDAVCRDFGRPNNITCASQARALFGLYLVLKKTTKPGSASAPMAELCEKTLRTLHKGTPTAAIVDSLFKTMSA